VDLKESLRKALQAYAEAMAKARQEHEKVAKLDKYEADVDYLTKASDACVAFSTTVRQLAE